MCAWCCICTHRRWKVVATVCHLTSRFAHSQMPGKRHCTALCCVREGGNQCDATVDDGLNWQHSRITSPFSGGVLECVRT
uniref:Putative secreted protein n=1 Tax=Anopheles darlingi TaxID=43151 RepID=A0A2M4D4Q5_ANODA